MLVGRAVGEDRQQGHPIRLGLGQRRHPAVDLGHASTERRGRGVGDRGGLLRGRLRRVLRRLDDLPGDSREAALALGALDRVALNGALVVARVELLLDEVVELETDRSNRGSAEDAAEDAGQDVAAVRARLAAEYTYNVASPFLAAERGELDGIIEPAATRISVIKALRALRTKRSSLPPKKHGNIPL